MVFDPEILAWSVIGQKRLLTQIIKIYTIPDKNMSHTNQIFRNYP